MYQYNTHTIKVTRLGASTLILQYTCMKGGKNTGLQLVVVCVYATGIHSLNDPLTI